MSKTIGIIGTGKTIGVANDHMNGIRAVPGWEMAAVYDLSEENAKAFAAKHKLDDSVVCQTLDALLDRVDAVTICTDNRSHEKLIRAALRRKLPVQCEKPLSLTYRESKTLAEEADQAGVVHYMAMQYRYHPYAQAIKEVVDQLGDIYYYRHKMGGARIANPNVGLEWRMRKELSGPGTMIDFGVHQFDLIHYLLRETCGAITEIQAELATVITERANLDGSGSGRVTNDDMAAVIVRLENGALVTLNNARVVTDDGNGLEIVGTKGAVWMDGRGELHIRGKKPNGAWGTAEPLPLEDRHQFPGLARGKQYQEFLDAIETNAPYELDFHYGAEVVRIVDAAVLAAEQGRKIKLSEIE